MTSHILGQKIEEAYAEGRLELVIQPKFMPQISSSTRKKYGISHIVKDSNTTPPTYKIVLKKRIN